MFSSSFSREPGKVRSLASIRAGILGRVALVALSAGFLAACQDTGINGKAFRPIPSATVALMESKGATRQSPILIRAFKKEAELEIWKMKANGEYTFIKTFPMCRWSGQLGPKRQEGDRQVPEGFYAITPGQMNPNSNYYLSFNVGYPNALDRAQGYTGGSIMVHGACSSAGCFSMTDEQIEEIYAIAREAFAGGQRAIQMQSYPFRMTPENLARHRLDPNMAFWRQLKEGNDTFEVTKREPNVSYCGRRYVFDATSAVPGLTLQAAAACPPLKKDPEVAALVSAKEKSDDGKVADLVAKGVQPIKLVYRDGGQHPSMASVMMVSRPEALEQGPVEIALDAKGRPAPAAVQVAAKAAPAKPVVASSSVANSSVAKPEAVAAAPKPASQKTVVRSSGPKSGETDVASAPEAKPQPSLMKRWLGFSILDGDADQKAEAAPTPAKPADTGRRAAVQPPKRPAAKAVAETKPSAYAPQPVMTGALAILTQRFTN